jgi:hypothetical protein
MKSVLAFFVLSISACAQTAASFPTVGQPWYTPTGYVPASSTAIATQTVIWSAIYLNNTSGSAVTVTITDTSTACGGSPCQLWGASIPANTIQNGPIFGGPAQGLVAVGGMKWFASTGSAVVGSLYGFYPANLTADSEWNPAELFARDFGPSLFGADL